ncbi:unnamed protein product [Dovyalis caffra]|uniref:Uncharacterized protein n=1 Tax=Dovyalis caffra TaxID=77055 RepID=A0AAV1S105_9ROSI|nr:unnamed protein product [Dovyalis caffra]
MRHTGSRPMNRCKQQKWTPVSSILSATMTSLSLKKLIFGSHDAKRPGHMSCKAAQNHGSCASGLD